ncbi:MAG: ATPase [Bacteroidales bacterium]|jgi:N-acetylglucosamine kinase-like BadF-type ATPase|nr:ATPase [Bacteroidales bacterium]
MKIIADSGSTKTDWCLINSAGRVKTVQTIGMNPYFLDENDILNILRKDLYPFLDNKKVEQVFFYGSGCALPGKKQVVQCALDFFFMHADVEVENDLFGAARALCGEENGLVCILGTGSSSCLYDGTQIIERLPSLGYILGDEGSGAYLGKKIVSAYFNNELPDHLQKLFAQKYPAELAEVLDKVYKQSFPNRFLATLVEFLNENKSDSFVKDLVGSAFDEFFKKQVLRYNNYNEYPLCFVGSVSFTFTDELRKSAEKHGLTIAKIEQTPLDGLLKYHKNS